MDESPLKSVRQKKDASIRVAFDLAKWGRVDAVVSAGNSGATLAAGILALGKLEGVERPALASIFPGERGYVILIDVGANVDCRPTHLFQFGVMAHAFASSCMGMVNPTIGLLSIGEEGSKGNEQVRLARKLYDGSQLNFVGNVEGRDIFTGEVQVIVCDGFVGNVALKLSEGMAETMTNLLKRELADSLFGRAGLLLGRGSLKRFKRKLDYGEYGGAPLLGINGVGIVCHGESSANAIKNAIKMAVQYANSRLPEKMVLQLKGFNDSKAVL
jgi:glycerol-3-phosphate acyltransferase PlsX